MRAKIITGTILLAALFLGVASGTAFTETQPAKNQFVPLEPIMTLSHVRPGMKAQVRTVLEGTTIHQFSATLIGVIPRKTNPKNLIIIRVDDKYVRENGGIAAGMSGSPVYVDGKLVGAIGYGWAFGDTSLGLVTPIEEMIKAMDWPDKIPQSGVSLKVPISPSEEKKPATDTKSADIKAGEVKSDDILSSDTESVGTAEEISDDIFIEVETEKEEISFDLEAALESMSRDLALSGDKDEGRGIEGIELHEDDGQDVSLNFPEELKNSLARLADAELQPLAMPLLVDGISPRMARRLKQRLGVEVIPLGASSGSNAVDLNASLEPGASIGVSLAWGDFQAGGIGTLTALDKNGRFLAFGHEMFGNGAVAYAATEASVVKIIPSIASSFKLGYQGAIVGIVTQDRSEAIGGRLRQLAPANGYTVRFHDVDTDRKVIKRFQTVADPFLGPTLGATGMLGIIDDSWGRVGEGTAILKYKLSGGHLPGGWRRTNVYFSEQDIVGEMTKEFETLSKIFALNQFQEIRPIGVELEIEITRDSRVVYIEKLKIVNEKNTYCPGEDIELEVTLRPWRKQATVKRLAIKVPEDAIGHCEIVVRGGGIEELDQNSVLAGYRAITSLEDLIKELNVEESNNQLVLEIKSDGYLFAPGASKSKKGKVADQEQESDRPSIEDFFDDRMKSEIIAERIKDQTMLIIDTNYFVEGLLRKHIAIDSKNGDANSAYTTEQETSQFEEDVIATEDRETISERERSSNHGWFPLKTRGRGKR